MALKTLKARAESGDTDVLYQLGTLYAHEDDEAKRWYKNAAVLGHIPENV